MQTALWIVRWMDYQFRVQAGKDGDMLALKSRDEVVGYDEDVNA